MMPTDDDNVHVKVRQKDVYKRQMELLDDHNLRLSGHFARESTQQDQTRSLWAKERMMGEFRRTFSFPTKLTPEQIKATMDSGVLKIEIIKGEEESKKIPIKID